MEDRQEIQIVVEGLGLGLLDTISRLGGLTNRSYYVRCGDEEFVVRLPGEGTSGLVNREDEYVINTIASQIGVDSSLRYFDQKTGVKVVSWVQNAETITPILAHDAETMKGMAGALRRLHTCNQSVPAIFNALEKVVQYENLIVLGGGCFWGDYSTVRDQVFEVAASFDSKTRVLCHNDPLCENFVRDVSAERMYLIDWEYAGMNDPMWDLADVIVEAEFSAQEQLVFERAYFGRDPEPQEVRAIAANAVLLNFLWCLWAKQRMCCGSDLSDYAETRYSQAKEALTVLARGDRK